MLREKASYVFGTGKCFLPCFFGAASRAGSAATGLHSSANYVGDAMYILYNGDLSSAEGMAGPTADKSMRDPSDFGIFSLSAAAASSQRNRKAPD